MSQPHLFAGFIKGDPIGRGRIEDGIGNNYHFCVAERVPLGEDLQPLAASVIAELSGVDEDSLQPDPQTGWVVCPVDRDEHTIPEVVSKLRALGEVKLVEPRRVKEVVRVVGVHALQGF